jgi:hypothetical protein
MSTTPLIKEPSPPPASNSSANAIKPDETATTKPPENRPKQKSPPPVSASNNNSAKANKPEIKPKKSKRQRNAAANSGNILNAANSNNSGNATGRPANLMDIKLTGGQLVNGFQIATNQRQQQQQNGYIVYKAPNLMDLNMQNMNPPRDLFSTSAPSRTEYIKNSSGAQQQQQQQFKHTVAGGLSRDFHSRQYNPNNRIVSNVTGVKILSNDRKSESNEDPKSEHKY